MNGEDVKIEEVKKTIQTPHSHITCMPFPPLAWGEKGRGICRVYVYVYAVYIYKLNSPNKNLKIEVMEERMLEGRQGETSRWRESNSSFQSKSSHHSADSQILSSSEEQLQQKISTKSMEEIKGKMKSEK